jgi:4-aminobutyrate aminotransferase-like enzyme
LRNALKDRCFEKGLFILPSGEKSIRFRPALNINEGEISEGMRIIESALKSLI